MATANTPSKKETTAVALPDDLKGSWGSENIDSADIVIPRLLLMQGMSEHVSAGKAKLGDIIKSTTVEVLGGKDKPVKIIPLISTKTWTISEKVGNKFEFRSIEPVSLNNSSLPLEWQQGNTTWRRDKCLDFFVLLSDDVAKERKALDKLKAGDIPDVADALLPCHLSFRRTSYNSGKTLATHFSVAGRFNLPPASTIFNLTSEVTKNDQGTFAIFEIKSAGKTSIDDLMVAKKWYDILAKAKSNVVIDQETVPVETATRVDVNGEEIPF